MVRDLVGRFKSNNSIVYLASNLIYAGIPFLLLPFVTRYLTPAEYGEFAIFQIFVLILTAFVGVSVRGNAVRKYFENRSEISEYIGSCIQVLMVLSVFVFFVLFLFESFVSGLFELDVNYIYLAVLVSFSMMLYRLQLGQYQAREEAWYYLFLQSGNAVANGAMVLTLVVFLRLGVDGQIASFALSSIIVAIFSVFLLLKSKGVIFKINRSHYSEIFRFGLPLLPHVLSGALISTIDRYYISLQAGNEQLGVYMVAVQIAMALNLMFDAYNKYNMPFVFSVMSGDKRGEDLFSRTCKGFVLVFLVGFSFSWFFGFLGVYIVGVDFYAAINILPFLIFGQCANGVYYLFVNQILYEKKTIMLSMLTMFSLVVHVSLLVLLLPEYGIFGAAVSFLVSQSAKAILCMVFSIKLTGFSLYKKRY